MVWVIGSRGMLGHELVDLLADSGVPSLATDREVDITDVEALRAVAARERPGWIVNCAAYTAVDRAEDEPELAYALNARGAENVAVTAREADAGLIHLSTDYVFDGTGTEPYTPDSAVNPVGVYARSKANGERRVRERCRRAYILRTAWLYGRYGRNFVSTMLRLFGERSEVGVVADQRGTPTYAPDLAAAISTIVERDRGNYGTYHYTNGGEATWYEFATEIHRVATELGLIDGSCQLKPLTTEQYRTRAVRPAYSVLSKESLLREFAVSVPPWESGVRRFLEEVVRGRDGGDGGRGTGA